MNLCRCEKGHFYDKEKYDTCPHCAGGSASDETLTTVFTEDATAPVTAAGGMEEIPGPPPFPVAGMAADQETVAVNEFNQDTPTVPLQPEIFPTFGPVSHIPKTEGMNEDDDHTVGFFDDDIFGGPAAGKGGSKNGMFASPAANKVSTPCVGWLIASGGQHEGTDFRLKVGKFFVGRSPQMDIALTEDKSVSRDKHAIVVYEPREHLYLVQPGESSSLVYHNNKVVLTPVQLQAYDMITVGDVNLLFMPLCGERFNWSDLLEEMKKNNK